MATAVVTGGAGFLGSHLCEALLSRGYRVICVDNLQSSALTNIEHLRDDAFAFRYHDVIEPIEIEGSVEFVFHLAALASPIDYLRQPLHSLKTGSYGTHNALGLAKWKRARFVLASTSEIYGDPLVHPQRETYWGNVNPVGPRGVYDEAKRYAEAMTMAYHSAQGVDTAIVRIFNSILEDEQVLYDDGRELRRESIADAAARVASRAVAAGYVPTSQPSSLAPPGSGFSPALQYPLDGYVVPSFGTDSRMTARPAVSLVAHPTDQPCYEIRTRYGRSVRVTADHSVFVEGDDGQPRAIEAAQLRIGDRIAVARRIDVPERDRTHVSMLDAWAFAENDPWNLLIEAPGLGALAWEKRDDLFGLVASEHRNNGPNWRNGAWTQVIRMRDADRVPLPALRRLVSAIPAGARVRQRVAGRSVSMPATVDLSDTLLWLLGVWVAEGGMYEAKGASCVHISGDEALLSRAADVIEAELGLHVVWAEGSEDRSASIYVHSKLFLRLLEYLGFERKAKRIPGWILGLPLSRLKWFIEGYREGDGVHSGEKLLDGRRHEFSTVNDELKDDLIVALARFGIAPSVGRYETMFRQRTGDRRYPFWRLTVSAVAPWSPLEWDQGVEQTLQARVTGDIVWAPVKAIDEIPTTALVYDFSVPGTENFWAGTGVMCHNTYGPRMRSHDGRAIPNFMRQALDGAPLTIYGDGSQTRSFCYVDDLIRGLVLLAESGEHLPVNLGNPGEFTIRELAETVLRVTGSESEIVYEALPVDDPQIRQPDITRAKQVLRWEPEIPLEEGLRRMLGSMRESSVVA
ncbi:MAG TPA: GDP-mannose 4,6-dehydratase [Gaiellaceae bacterium]|nr:GDP-mannose 4,6-dehydratase [Gaiellaceae bacterium]